MSTKTNFKRIALVAVAALGLGVLSSVPSQAVVSNLTVTVNQNGTATYVKSDSTTAATFTIAGLVEAGDSVTAYVVTKSIPSGGGAVRIHNLDSSTPNLTAAYRVDTLASNTTAGNSIKAGNAADSMTVLSTTAAASVVRVSMMAATANISHTFGVQLDSTTPTTRIAGTYSYSLVVKAWHAGSANSAAGVAQPDQTIVKDFTITIAAAADLSTTATSTYGFANISSTSISNGATSTTDESISALATAGTTRGYIFVANRNASNGSTTALDSLTATVTGVGLVCDSAGTTCGKNIKVSAAGDYQFRLQGDGTGGTSTISISSLVTGATFTKSLTYYAAAAKTLTASVLTPVLGIGANDSAVAVTAVDAAGAVWGGTAYIYASAAADATAVGGSATTPVACTFRSANGTHYCPITAVAAGTGKFKVIDAATVALATATSNEVSVTSSNNQPATVKIAFNKASYVPYEAALITVTPLDSAGKPLAAGTYASLLASGGISASTGFASGFGGSTATDIAATSITTSAYSGTNRTAGALTYVVYMPASGTVTLTAKGGSNLPVAGQVTVTASATISDSGTAALAAVNALATTVASLKTLITTLTNLVLKIQKKVKA